MKERFMLADNEMFLRDMKHLKSYSSIEDIIDVMNKVNKSDNCAVDIIKKEIEKQDDEKVIIALERILKQIYSLNSRP